MQNVKILRIILTEQLLWLGVRAADNYINSLQKKKILCFDLLVTIGIQLYE